MKDFYYILGTEANCTSNEIKEAYRKLSKKFHPDLNQGDQYFENRFREIKEAYDTLCDPVKRSRYDAALKKFKSNPAEEHQKRQYYREQAKNQHYQGPPSAYTKPKTKGPGIGMTVVLILLGLIAAVYLVESFSNSKAHKAKIAVIVSIPSSKTHKHHKKKHSLKGKADDSSKHNSDSTDSIRPVQHAASINKPVVAANKQPVPVTKKQVLPESNKNADYSGSFLYATYVRTNITGVINMRENDDFSSSVIKTIPANSKVFVLEKGNVYYRVYFNDHIGYVPKWSLQIK